MTAAGRGGHGRPAIALAAIVMLLAAGICAPAQRAAASADPRPKLACADVELAPRLASDRGTPAAQTLDARGRYVPVLMVHGWTSRAAHSRSRTGAFSHLVDLSTDPANQPSAERSLVGQIQKLPGAAVFTFDYHQYSARWVDDDHLGPALGRAIDCLHSGSGEKVIVVGHSMGGLIARYALTEQGADRAGKVSTVVTFGTPQTGSLMADLAAGVIDAGAERGNTALVLLRIILAECGARTAQRFETGTLCDFLPAFAKAFDTPAGNALQTGSPELEALPDFPTGVTALDALAGDTTLKAQDLGWFGSSWNESGGIPMGDMIVMTDSAQHRATARATAACAYELSPVRSAADAIAFQLGQASRSSVPQPLWKAKGPCFHTSLMRTINLTAPMTATLNDDIAGRPPNGTPQPPLTAQAVVDDAVPVCREYTAMSGEERDVVLRRMQEAHGNRSATLVTRISVSLFCKLNPGRRIDGVYAPRSRSNPADGGAGPIPRCSDWREMDDAAGDAALLRVARARGDGDPSISTLRLTVGAFCAIYPERRIDEVPGGG